MGQTGLDVDAAKLLKRLQTWPMVSVGAVVAENSKTFGCKPMGVRSPLPAPIYSVSYAEGCASLTHGKSFTCLLLAWFSSRIVDDGPMSLCPDSCPIQAHSGSLQRNSVGLTRSRLGLGFQRSALV
jgi:hypothetical protein